MIHAIHPALGKVLDIIVMNRYRDGLMSSNLQLLIKPKHSTVLCAADTREIIAHYTSFSSIMYVCTLDATKAFGKASFLKLFYLFLKRNKASLILRIVLDMYTRQSAKATWNGTNSFHINVSNGARQIGLFASISHEI